MGVGPFQGGSIRENTKLVGNPFRFGRRTSTASAIESIERPVVDISAETRFNQGWPDFGNVGFGPELLASGADESDEASGEESEDAESTRIAETPSDTTTK